MTGSDESDGRDGRLAVPDDWTEVEYERGTYGPDDRPGVAAAFERGSARVAVAPVRFERTAGEERFEALAADWTTERRQPTAITDDVAACTAFAVRLAFEPFATRQTALPVVARDAGDALAVAVWLSNAADDDRALGRALKVHWGNTGATGASVSDDDALGAYFAPEPAACAVTGKPTRSHVVDVPYRYVAALPDPPRTGGGVLRFPSTIATLVAAVSHDAWATLGLEDVGFDAPPERDEAGVYRLPAEAVAAAAEMDGERLVCRRLGED